MATSAIPTGGMIDPTKQAEYPVLLGGRLTGQDNFSQSRLINFNYNYKTKSATPQQRSTVTRSSQSNDLYNLTITDKPQSTESNTLTYLYEGSVDPIQESEVEDYVLVFDSDRKAFVLEPVVTRLNFNLRSAPAKTEKQVLEQYEQLRTLQEDQQVSGDEQVPESVDEDEDGPADESNPYDFRHFLPKAGDEDDEKEKSSFDRITPEPQVISKPDTLSIPAPAKRAPSPRPRPNTLTNPPQQKKTEPAKKKTELTAKAEPTKKKEPPPPEPSPKPEAKIEVEEFGEPESKSTPSDTGTAALESHKAIPSPGSNIIIDGDLIIDMGSPPPSRPAFNINPAHFSSNGTPSNGAEDDEDGEEMEDLRLPSPAGHTAPAQQAAPEPAQEEEVEDDDALAAEMEAAFEESAMEEQNVHSYSQPASQQYHAHSDDESEVSEEE
ncbi:ELL-associated factor [Aspergillus ruber CBS 135680]|uniref:Transcription elongation factor Eaf N-terminal domain-containing protein n=1 Tax=Aspergillus ruber (strain CBS 135680) TaxID=1388766 RepID=A0A017SPP9_ASPRC|nr:uncharacterized protein EURHEDRAFT_409581 [Aspergillus ruber CBS 135680]EYE98245.1 hypothetical protein EURHEDRAFT_409581 [Aspergillus ruber CBS 135680]